MGKRLRIFLSERDYDLLERFAKNSGKSLSQFARELLINSLKQELKDTQLLNKMIQKIESLETQAKSDINIELFKQLLNHNTSILIECFLALSNEFFFDRKKHENFVLSVKQILQKIE